MLVLKAELEIFLIKEEQKNGFRFDQLFGFIKSNKISHFLASYLFVRLSTLFVVVVVMVVVLSSPLPSLSSSSLLLSSSLSSPSSSSQRYFPVRDKRESVS